MRVDVIRRARGVPAALVRRAARAALRRAGGRGLPTSVVVLNDSGIARPHRLFLGGHGPTDVLSFRYPGKLEVLVSVETARREAAARGIPWREELARYVVHGVLHGLGFRDARPRERRRMWRVQEEIVADLRVRNGA